MKLLLTIIFFFMAIVCACTSAAYYTEERYDLVVLWALGVITWAGVGFVWMHRWLSE